MSDHSDEESNPRPFSRDRWPEYADPLRLEPQAHRRLADRFMEKDEPHQRARDWARRFDVSGAGWALAEVHPIGRARARFVVYPVNISLTGAGIIHSAPLDNSTRVSIHFDRLVTGAFSLSGSVRRTVKLDKRALLIGIRWDLESVASLVDHLAPPTSGTAMKHRPGETSPEQAITDAAYRSMYAENRLGHWAAVVAGD